MNWPTKTESAKKLQLAKFIIVWGIVLVIFVALFCVVFDGAYGLCDIIYELLFETKLLAGMGMFATGVTLYYLYPYYMGEDAPKSEQIISEDAPKSEQIISE